jgi:polysaccharide biosynthesis protein PslL
MKPEALKTAKGLGIVLVLLNLVPILGVIKSILTGSYTTEKHLFYAGHFLTQIRGGSDLTGTMAVFWFPPCLAFSLLIAGGALQHSRLAGFATSFVSLILISTFAERIRELPSTLGLKSSIGAIPLIIIGWMLNNDRWCRLPGINFELRTAGESNGMNRDRWHHGLIISAAVVIIAAFICRVPLADLTFNMKYADFGTVWYSFPFAVIMSCVLLFIAGHLGNSQLSSPIRYLGRASMTIMYLHMFVLLTPVLNIVPAEARIFLALLLPAAVHLGFARHPVFQRLFLGQFPSADQRSVSVRGAI